MSLGLIAAIFVLIAVVMGVKNNEFNASTFWFLLAICTALILSSVRI
jgi:hypothetical protein